MKTVAGLFDNYQEAEACIQELVDQGIPRDHISVVANQKAHEEAARARSQTSTTPEETGSETAKGAVAGGVTGLLIGLVSFALPVAGAVAVAGWLATLVGGAIVGAGVGLIGALTHAGVPREHAAYYAEGIRRGGTLLAVKADDAAADHVAQLFRSFGAADIEQRGAQYRTEGFAPPTLETGAAQPQSAAAAAPAPPPTAASTPSAAGPMESTSHEPPAAWAKSFSPAYSGTTTAADSAMAAAAPGIAGNQPVTSPLQTPEGSTSGAPQSADEAIPVNVHPVSQSAGPASGMPGGEPQSSAARPLVGPQGQPVVAVETWVVQEVVPETDSAPGSSGGSYTGSEGGREHAGRSGSTGSVMEEFEQDFHTRYAGQGGRWEDYQPAYQYGYNMGSNPQYQGQDWNAVQSQAQQVWNLRYPNSPWDRFSSAIRTGYERAPGRMDESASTSGQPSWAAREQMTRTQ